MFESNHDDSSARGKKKKKNVAQRQCLQRETRINGQAEPVRGRIWGCVCVFAAVHLCMSPCFAPLDRSWYL